MKLRPIVLFILVGNLACAEQVVVRETEGQCGNGSVELGEACDDGNELNTDACTNGCDVARCGDGVSRADLEQGEEGFEVCDDGNDLDTDACSNACQPARCGDGIVRMDRSEGDDDFEACDAKTTVFTMISKPVMQKRPYLPGF